MIRNIAIGFMLSLMLLQTAVSQENASHAAAPAAPAAKIRRMADGHPDLSGVWDFAISIPPEGIAKVVNGQKTVTKYDRSARYFHAEVLGALPWTKAPDYKPEFQAKVAELSANESKMDAVFYCGRPGVPRIGSPRRIVQSSNELIFFYEEISGDVFRFIPVNGKHHTDFNPSYYGDAVGYWAGDTLVVDTTNFVDNTWFGEEGYFHSDALRVTERLWRVGDDLAYQVTVDDPKVLAKPWTNYTHLIHPSSEPLQESPPCKEEDGARLLNLDHHVQR